MRQHDIWRIRHLGRLSRVRNGGGGLTPAPGESALLWNDGEAMTWPDGEYVTWPTVTLLTDLVSQWGLSDTSDSHGSNTLTNTAVTFAPGKIDDCGVFAPASFANMAVASNSGLQSGNVDYYMSCWVKSNQPAETKYIISKVGIPGTNSEFLLRTGLGRFKMNWYTDNAGSQVIVTANTFGDLTSGVWYFLEAYHDATNNLIGIAVNGGSFDTASATGGNLSTAQFQIGASEGNPSYWDGEIDEVMIRKRLPTEEQRAALYNGGDGLAYPYGGV